MPFVPLSHCSTCPLVNVRSCSALLYLHSPSLALPNFISRRTTVHAVQAATCPGKLAWCAALAARPDSRRPGSRCAGSHAQLLLLKIAGLLGMGPTRPLPLPGRSPYAWPLSQGGQLVTLRLEAGLSLVELPSLPASEQEHAAQLTVTGVAVGDGKRGMVQATVALDGPLPGSGPRVEVKFDGFGLSSWQKRKTKSISEDRRTLTFEAAASQRQGLEQLGAAIAARARHTTAAAPGAEPARAAALLFELQPNAAVVIAPAGLPEPAAATVKRPLWAKLGEAREVVGGEETRTCCQGCLGAAASACLRNCSSPCTLMPPCPCSGCWPRATGGSAAACKHGGARAAAGGAGGGDAARARRAR